MISSSSLRSHTSFLSLLYLPIYSFKPKQGKAALLMNLAFTVKERVKERRKISQTKKKYGKEQTDSIVYEGEENESRGEWAGAKTKTK